MAKVNYVTCSACDKEYYIDRILSEALISNPAQKLKCPYCKATFQLQSNKDAKNEQQATA